LLAGPLQAQNRPASGDSVAAFAPLDKAVTSHMDLLGCTAGTVAVSRDGKVLYARGFGWRDQDRKRPTPPDALMRIGSITKPITAAAIKELIAAGKLAADARAFALLQARGAPKFADKRLADVTITHLLEHKAGWDHARAGDPVFKLDAIARDLRQKGPVQPTDLVLWLMSQPLQLDPGKKSVYSNVGYSVLGRVIEQATGKPYFDSVRQLVLEPNGIEDIVPARSAARDRPPREVQYTAAGEALVMESLDSTGGLAASAPALCRFLESYWITGQRRLAGQPGQATFFGTISSTTALVLQRPDGCNVAVLLNGRREKHYEADNRALEKAVETALEKTDKGK
jgi:N-acyl-D-amino-acid deacylase